MAGKFQRKCFSEINLDDPFFDSLKADYPGTANSTGFITWFRKKASSGKTALVFEDELGIGAFINLKPDEAEEIQLADGRVLPKVVRLKITTIKIDERYRHQRIGEGAIGLTLWQWRDLGTNEIYVTVFDKHHSLIFLLEKYGFNCVGKNINGEKVYIKDRRNLVLVTHARRSRLLGNRCSTLDALLLTWNTMIQCLPFQILQILYRNALTLVLLTG